jgi:hypothetical protein
MMGVLLIGPSSLIGPHSARADEPQLTESRKRDQDQIRVHVQGSFEIQLGEDRVARGQGSVTIEVDSNAVELLGSKVQRMLREYGPSGEEMFSAIAALPGMLKSTSEILNSLSEPETQNALRRVEKLMSLLPQSALQPQLQPPLQPDQP